MMATVAAATGVVRISRSSESRAHCDAGWPMTPRLGISTPRTASLPSAKLPLHREVSVRVKYKGIDLPPGFRADIIVDSAVLVDIKAVPNLTASHEAQRRTYRRLSGIRVGLLLNFHEQTLKPGLKRFIV